MDIPDNFTITIQSETAPINYTVLRCSDDMFVVKWERPKNSFHYVELSRVEVIDALNRGFWTIVEQKEKTMQQNTIEQMEQTVEQLLAKAEELKQQIEAAKKEEDVWPKIGSQYWFALSNADVDNSTWNYGEVDEYRMMFGNVHRTKEDAENYVQKRLVQAELECLAAKAWNESGKQVNWTDEYQSKYHIYYDYIDKEFYVSENSNSQYIGQVFFPTKESAINAVETISEERLKKLFM